MLKFDFTSNRIQNGYAGIHSGAYGGLIGSPIFGPGGIGPFNNPAQREHRIEQLININRKIQNRPPLAARRNAFENMGF